MDTRKINNIRTQSEPLKATEGENCITNKPPTKLATSGSEMDTIPAIYFPKSSVGLGTAHESANLKVPASFSRDIAS